MPLTSAACALGPCAAAPRALALGTSRHPPAPRAAPLVRVQRCPTRRGRRTPPPPRAESKEQQAYSAAGQDLSFPHVAHDVKRRLAGVVGGRANKADQLQSWLSQAKLTHTEESDAEANQTELVAQEEAEHMDLQHLGLDIKRWLDGPESDKDAQVAGLLTVRLLQAYHEGAGEPFDDENEDCYWRLQGFLPGELVEALDHPTLTRMIKSFVALPFSGV